jgi:SAM-dependent methyltransferase
MASREHWEAIYTEKSPTDVSWYQSEPALSLQLIMTAAPERDRAILDVGGGASTLVDALLEQRYAHVTVSDISEAALHRARSRVGAAAAGVEWRRADILEDDLPGDSFDVWHDRAVFHFMTTAEDRARYLQQALSALRMGGTLILATFAQDGPQRCSGLDTMRYSPEMLAEELRGFDLVESVRETHVTPSGVEQRFQYCVFRKTQSSRNHL